MLTKLQSFLKHNLDFVSKSRFVYERVPGETPPPVTEKGPDKPEKPTTIDTAAKTPGGVNANLDQLAKDAGVKPKESDKPQEGVKTPVDTKSSEVPEKAPEPQKKVEEYVLEYWEKERQELAKNKVDVNIDKRGVIFPKDTQRAFYFFVRELAAVYPPANDFKNGMLSEDGAQIDAMFNGNDSQCAKTLGFYWDAGNKKWRMDENWGGEMNDDALGSSWDGADPWSFIASIPTLIDMYANRSGEFTHLSGEPELAKNAILALQVAYTKHQLLSVKPEAIAAFEYEKVKYPDAMGSAIEWMELRTKGVSEFLDKSQGKWISLANEDRNAVSAMYLLSSEFFKDSAPTDYMYMKQGDTVYMRRLDGAGPMTKVNLAGKPNKEVYNKETFAGLWHPVNFATVPAEKVNEELSVLARKPEVQSELPKGAVPEAVAGAAAEAIAAKERERLKKYIDTIKPEVEVKNLNRSVDRIESSFESKLRASIGEKFDKSFTDEAAKKEKAKVEDILVEEFMKDFRAKKEELLKKYEGVERINAGLEEGKIELKASGAKMKLKELVEKGKDAADKAKDKLEQAYLKQYNDFMGGKLGSIVGFLVSFGLLDEKKVKDHIIGIFKGEKKGIFAMYLASQGVGTTEMVDKYKKQKPGGLVGRVFGIFDKAVDRGMQLAEQGGVPMESVKTSTIGVLKQELNAAPLREDTIVDMQTAAALGEDNVFVARMPAGTNFKPRQSLVKYRNVGQSDWEIAVPGQEYTNIEVNMSTMGGEVLPKGSTLVAGVQTKPDTGPQVNPDKTTETA